jgi:TolA-binding protein
MVWWLEILLALIATSAGIGGLVVSLLKLRSERGYTEANTSEKFEKIARDAAESILQKSDRIKDLEQQTEQMRLEINALKDERTVLARDRKRLESRVLKLENILNAHNIPFPANGG